MPLKITQKLSCTIYIILGWEQKLCQVSRNNEIYLVLTIWGDLIYAFSIFIIKYSILYSKKGIPDSMLYFPRKSPYFNFLTIILVFEFFIFKDTWYGKHTHTYKILKLKLVLLWCKCNKVYNCVQNSIKNHVLVN